MNPCQVNITPMTSCFTNPQAEKLSRSLLTKSSSNSSARDLIDMLMILSGNSLGNNPFPTKSPWSFFCHVNDYLWHIIFYGIHFVNSPVSFWLTPLEVYLLFPFSVLSRLSCLSCQQYISDNFFQITCEGDINSPMEFMIKCYFPQ